MTVRTTRRPSAALTAATLGASAAAVLAGCGPVTSGEEQLVVFAAASLSTVFTELEPAFEDAHDADVTFSFAGSSELVAQVEAGAPADVLVTADERTMARAQEAGLLDGEPVLFASNHLTLVTPPGNPAGITGLDASLDGASLVVCAPQVPCGAAATQLADRLGVTLAAVSEELSVTSVLGKVTSGQADAGLVYVSDARGADATAVPVARAEEVVNLYPAAVVAGGGAAAEAWVEFLTGPEATAALAEAGFGSTTIPTSAGDR